MIALRPDHEVDRWRAAHDFGALGLGHTARDRDRDPASIVRRRLLDQAYAAKLRIDLLGRLLADVAGVEDHQVGIGGLCGLGVTGRRQGVRHTIGIVDVHLAAE